MRPAALAAATTIVAAIAAPTGASAATVQPSIRPAAQPARAATPAEDAALARAIASTLDTPAVRAATTGVVVRDQSTGAIVYSRNASTPLAPASTAKSRTVAAGLSLLGRNFTWHTDVLTRGTRSGATLTGALVVKGYGDPTLTRSDLASLARQVRAAGITRVTGGIVTDATYFDAVRTNPAWGRGDLTQYYAAPVSGLTLAPSSDYEPGTVVVSYSPGAPGGPARVSTVPAAAASYLKVVSAAKTTAAGTGDHARVDQDLTTGTVTVRGSIAHGLSARSVVKITPSPQMYAATVLRAELVAAGVTVTGGAAPGAVRATDRRVATDRSMPLHQAIRPLMKASNNIMAEHVLKTISAQAGGRGTWPDGAARVTAWMRGAGVPMTGVRVVDGSGLARTNRETALSEAGLLRAMRGNSDFYDALPVAGNPDRSVGGTLRGRLGGTAAANNLHAKTGTLTGVTALSGYVSSANGRSFTMSMISSYTGVSPRPVENALALTLARWNGVATTTARPGSLTATTPRVPASAIPDDGAGEWTKRTR